MTASSMIRPLREATIPVPFAEDTYADRLTKWSLALELNPDNLNKNELVGVLVSVAMSMILQGATADEFDGWYQFGWAATEKLGRKNKGRGFDRLQLTGPPSPKRVGDALKRAWTLAERNHQDVVLPDVSLLRQRLENHPSYGMGGVVSTENSVPARTRRGRPPKLSPVALFDDMVSEMHRLNQATFTYPCRRAADRLGVDKETVCNALKKLCVLGITEQVQRGEVKGLSGEGYADASRYRFLLEPPIQAMGGVLSTDKSDQHKPKPTKKKSVCKLPLKVMKRIDQKMGPLTYQMVLDHGGDVTHWQRWIRHLQRDHRTVRSKEDHYKLVVAENDPHGSIAMDTHRRRQALKSYEFRHRPGPLDRELWAADRRRMRAALRARGISTGSTVTVRRELVSDGYVDMGYSLVECYRFTIKCPGDKHALVSLGDVKGRLAAESVIRLIEAQGVVVDRQYPPSCW